MAQRLAAGGYGPDPRSFGPASLRNALTLTATVSAQGTAELDRELAILTASQTVHEPAFESSAPVIGRVIVMTRRAWNWMSTKWYVRPIVAQQNRINRQATSVMSALAQQHELDEQRISDLQTRVTELEQRLARLERAD